MQKAILFVILAVIFAGCTKLVHFPAETIGPAKADVKAYDVNFNKKADFFTFLNSEGRINRIGYDSNADGQADEIINLDAIDFASCRHMVIILDGFGYETVKKYYDEGGLRLFHPPTKVIAPYPTMTDLCMEDIFNYIHCPAFEARYFDRKANHCAGGKDEYLAGRNEPYNDLLDYRADTLWDAIGYLYTQEVFGKELNDLKRKWDLRKHQQFFAYIVSSAGVSTQKGEQGQRECLRQIDRLTNQLLWETRGLVKITLMADHGHSYIPSKRIDFETYLKNKKWRLTKSLAKPRDVVYVQFGLVTYASFATQSPAELAVDLVGCNGVEIASYVQQDSVIVLDNSGGKAQITRKASRYKYQPQAGDPLKLAEILKNLKSDAEGYMDAEELFEATKDHIYPAPLQRIWRAHFALVENTPDVIVSLADEYYSGSQGFDNFVNIASTHGGLNQSNSATFIMSTVGPINRTMQSKDVPAVMQKLTGKPWPSKK